MWLSGLLGLLGVLVLLGPLPVHAKSLFDSNKPEYASLSEKMHALEKSGELRKALALIPRIYACEDIPVSAYYNTLANRRLALLRGILGKNSHACLLKEFYQLLSRPDHAWRDLSSLSHLPPARFLYLCLAGFSKKPVLAKPGLEGLDLKACVQSNDPWLVSAAMFVGRKKVFQLTWPEVKQRARARADLWDDICARQALLFWASSDRPGADRPEAVKQIPGFLLGPDQGALRDRLALVPQGECLVQLGVFDPRNAWFVRQDPFFEADFLLERKNCEPQRPGSTALQLRAGAFTEIKASKGEFTISPKGSDKKTWSQTIKCLSGKCIRILLPGD